MAVACLVAVFLAGGPARPKAVHAQATERPNIVLILVDDMTFRDAEHMTKLHSLMMDRGTTFDDGYVTNATCVPSRSTILRGQYTHNHRVPVTNQGYQRFHGLGHEDSTVATWLQSAGYRTALFGKYFNGYGGDAPTDPPPGWDEWFANFGDPGYYDYQLNENGQLVRYGSVPEDYKTDVLSRNANDFVRRSTGDGQPFFAYLAPPAPHEPAVPAPRHENLFSDVTAPRSPSFDEVDVSDKPEWIRSRPPLTATQIAKIDALYGDQVRSLQAVDDMIESLVDTLKNEGELDNTYIFFASDNGFHMGQHRMTYGKWTAYEEDVRMPLVVRGPGVPAGRVSGRLVLNNDLAPTFADLVGVEPPSFVDGRSLVPLLGSDPPSSAEWRSAFLVESARDGDLLTRRTRPAFEAVKTKRHVYVEYESGERELYDLAKDPYELDNFYPSADPDLLARLRTRLGALDGCATGAECGLAEDGGVPADTVAPETIIDNSPSVTSRSSTALISFSSSEAGSTFKCSLDGAAFVPCSSPQEFTALADGSHTFRARATDAAGNTDPTPARTKWAIDTVPPSGTVTINGGDTSTFSRTVTLTLSASDPELGSGVYKMRVRNRGSSWSGWEPYDTTKTWQLNDSAGKKTVNVQYKDGVGNVSATAFDRIYYAP